MIQFIKLWLNRFQTLLDLKSDSWLGLFTALMLLRILAVFKNYPPITMSEATAYSFAISAFAYSRTGGPKS